MQINTNSQSTQVTKQANVFWAKRYLQLQNAQGIRARTRQEDKQFKDSAVPRQNTARPAPQKRYYESGYFKIETVEPSSNPNLQYRFYAHDTTKRLNQD